MDYITIAGIKPYDGRYPLNLEQEFTTREWGWVKRLAGYLPLTLTDDAMSDPELACVLAVIMLRRAGRIEPSEVPSVFERLVDAPFGSAITIEVGEQETEQEEGDAGPPPTSSNGSESTSGDSGRTSSETLPPTQPASGILGSDISASHLATRLVT